MPFDLHIDGTAIAQKNARTPIPNFAQAVLLLFMSLV
jgi:hypothetical protein